MAYRMEWAVPEGRAPTLYQVRVIRDSASLGMDAGTIADVIAEYGGKVDLRVTRCDMTIVGLDRDHPDIERMAAAPKRTKYTITMILEQGDAPDADLDHIVNGLVAGDEIETLIDQASGAMGRAVRLSYAEVTDIERL
jgi:hypothetical protein